MEVDLTLLVVESHGSSRAFAHTRIVLHRQRELWDALSSHPQINARPCGAVSTYTDGGYGVITETAYGEPMYMLFADELADLMQVFDEKPGESLYDLNRAVMAYCRALPPRTNIALHWT